MNEIKWEIKNKKYLVSLQTELSNLEREFNQELEQLVNAQSNGDFSENADWQKSLEKREILQKDIIICKQKIKEWEEIEKNEKNECFFVYSDLTNGVEKEVMIVDRWNVSPEDGRISKNSPLGAALKSLKEGEEIEVITNGIKKKLRLLKKKNILIKQRDVN
jgi:transcription elongation GreA/GreB family factor